MDRVESGKCFAAPESGAEWPKYSRMNEAVKPDQAAETRANLFLNTQRHFSVDS